MSRILNNILLAVAIGATSVSCSSALSEGVISDGWKLVSPEGKTYPASVPSTVLGTLVSDGVYGSDVLEADNYRNIDASIFEDAWTYTRKFGLSSKQLSQNVLLEFDGLNYYADIILNGQKIASSDTLFGPYRRHSFDISDIVSANNVLEVSVSPAKPGDLNIGFVDWNPRPHDKSMGIFRDVSLDFCNKVQVKNPAVFSSLNSDYTEADLTLAVDLRNLTTSAVRGYLEGTVGGKTFSYPVEVPSDATLSLSLSPGQISQFHVTNPKLWWCRGLGDAHMYDASVCFRTDDGVTDSKDFSFGIREITSEITETGTRQLYLNGRRVLMRGAGWTDDIFLRNPASRNEIELAYVLDMNLNTIRFENIWGTSQNIYDLCDRNGILVMVGWSCYWEWAAYTGSRDGRWGCITTEEQFDLMGKSMEDQLTYLRNHPSIVMFLGGSDKTPHPTLERIYMDVISRVAPKLTYVTSAKGMRSSVAGYSGMRMAGPYDYVGPSYWFEERAEGTGLYGFNTETGIGAQIPQKESVKRMIPEEDLFPVGKMWDYHCTTAGEAMHSLDVLKDVMASTYGPASDLDDFLKKADLLSYDGTRSMFEAFRANAPETGGIIQWMLNSAWPSMYWQLYDWYLAPTAAYYAVRHANEPLQMVYDYSSSSVVAVNETASSATVSKQITFIAADGEIMMSEDVSAMVDPLTPVKVADIPAGRGGILFVGDNVYALPSENELHAWNRTDWIRTPLDKGADFSWMDSLKQADTAVSVEKTLTGYKVTLSNESDVPAFFIRMALLDRSQNLVSPAHWSDNYVSLAPHQSRTYNVDCMNRGACSSIVVEGWNVKSETRQL